jgi:hypothetical protein
MDIGSGITLGATVISGAAVVIKWISASAKSNTNGNGNKDRYFDCSAHSGIVTMLEVLKNGQEEIRADIKELLSRG